MNLVWKLLRQHISKWQFVGFFFANLLGMLIVLLSIQFYQDIIPVFTQGDSFIKKDYLVVSKKIGLVGAFTGGNTKFSEDEIADLKRQRFVHTVGSFTSSQYRVDASMGVKGTLSFSTEMFFESVQDEFVDVESTAWDFDPDSRVIPIVLPRNYLALYNFGFAQSRSLPQISEGLIGMIDIAVRIRGNGRQEVFQGRVIGFSNRLNTILVPQDFMTWSNETFAPDADIAPTRLIVEVNNPADESIAAYLSQKNYETDQDKLDAGKTTYFLKLITGLVLIVGLLISALSFYILILSIYLLVQKNTTKLENLLLIGYSPQRVALPYQLLAIGMNALVLLIVLVLLAGIRSYYLDLVLDIFPQMQVASMLPAYLSGAGLFVLVCLINIGAIRRKVMNIWYRKEL